MVSHTASLVALVLLFSLCVALLLWGACESFSMPWSHQTLSPMIQAGCDLPGSQVALVGALPRFGVPEL